MNDHDLFQRFSEEFKALCANEEALNFKLTRQEMWAVLAQLQLAYRHPQNIGPTWVMAEAIARRLQAIVAPSGALAEIAEQGWNPRYDG